MNFKKLDVRKLLNEGIEPFPHIRKKIDSLKDGEGVAVVAPFLPSPLIEVLRSENFASRVEHGPNGSWTTYFWRDASDAK